LRITIIFSIDTEFPGFLYQNSGSKFQDDNDSKYKIVKQNVDNLNLIQVGITISNADGNLPEGTTSWQFNLRFDLEKEKYSGDSIGLLEMAGIDFDLNLRKGISQEEFAEYFLSSGLILNDDVYWITFHGIYDFAYLIKALTNFLLPKDEEEFHQVLAVYFPNFYDIRCIINNFSWIRGSLSKICSDFEIKRVGNTHQAGSDALVTTKLFFKLLYQYSEQMDFIHYKNKLFDMTKDNTEEDLKVKSIQYQQTLNPYYNNIASTGYNKSNNNNCYKNLTNGNMSNGSNNNGFNNNFNMPLNSNMMGYYPQNFKQNPNPTNKNDNSNLYNNNQFGNNVNPNNGKNNYFNLDNNNNFYINNLYLNNNNNNFKILGSEIKYYQNNVTSN